MPRQRVVVATRGSLLARAQVDEVVARLRALSPDLDVAVQVVSSKGDRAQDVPLASLGVGVFTREVQAAVLRGEAEVAVHSLKDLPLGQTPGLVIGALPERADPREAVVSRGDLALGFLMKRSRVGTSSPRRMAQVRAFRPDLRVVPIRGNVDTRVRKVLDYALPADEHYDAAVLAAAGLLRSGLGARIAEYLDPTWFVPAPGQGALAVEARADDVATLDLLRRISHIPTERAVEAERALLAELGGGCHLSLGALARVEGDRLTLVGGLGAVDGSRMLRAEASGPASTPGAVAKDVARQLADQGAWVLLRSGAAGEHVDAGGSHTLRDSP